MDRGSSWVITNILLTPTKTQKDALMLPKNQVRRKTTIGFIAEQSKNGHEQFAKNNWEQEMQQTKEDKDISVKESVSRRVANHNQNTKYRRF